MSLKTLSSSTVYPLSTLSRSHTLRLCARSSQSRRNMLHRQAQRTGPWRCLGARQRPLQIFTKGEDIVEKTTPILRDGTAQSHIPVNDHAHFFFVKGKRKRMPVNQGVFDAVADLHVEVFGAVEEFSCARSSLLLLPRSRPKWSYYRKILPKLQAPKKLEISHKVMRKWHK